MQDKLEVAAAGEPVRARFRESNSIAGANKIGSRNSLDLAASGILIALLLLVGCGAGSRDWSALKQEIRQRYPEVTQISVDELDAWQADTTRKPPVLIDARSEAEFAVSHLEGARRAESAAEVASLGVAKTDPIVVYCSVGYRSSRLAAELMADGYQEVYNLEGSIFEWANSGRPVFRDGEQVSQVHPYNRDWGQLLNRALWSDIDQ